MKKLFFLFEFSTPVALINSLGYKVYDLRKEYHILNDILEPPASHVLTVCFALLGVLGIAANVVVLLTFYLCFPYWRRRNIMWVNLAICLIGSSITLVIQSIGDVTEAMSATKTACAFRLLLPRFFDLSTFGCLPIMLIDRITILQFPNLFIYNRRNDNCKIVYNWTLGLFYIVYEVFIKTENYEPTRCLGPFTKVHPWEMVTFLEMCLTIFLLLVALLSYIFSPYQDSDSQRDWLENELEETARVLMLTLTMLMLCLPKPILLFYFIATSFPSLDFQIYTTLLELAFRLMPLLPFIILLKQKNFLKAVKMIRAPLGERTTFGAIVGATEARAHTVLNDALLALYPHHPDLVHIKFPEGSDRPPEDVVEESVVMPKSKPGSTVEEESVCTKKDIESMTMANRRRSTVTFDFMA